MKTERILCAGKMCSVVVLKKGPVVEAEKSIASQLRQVRLIFKRLIASVLFD